MGLKSLRIALLMVLSLCLIFWVSRIMGFVYILPNYLQWDYIVAAITGLSIIGAFWDKLKTTNAILLIILLIPIVFVTWFFSHLVRPVPSYHEELKYLITEDRDHMRFKEEAYPGDMSTYTLYKKVVGPVFKKELSYRDATNEKPHNNKEADEIISNENK